MGSSKKARSEDENQEQGDRPSRTLPLEFGLVFVAALAILGHIQWICPWVVGVDAYFHEKMAILIRDHGPVRDFPWTQASIFRDHFSDSSFLYHTLLIPFTWIGDDITAIKLGAVVFSSLFFAAFYLFLRVNRCQAPVFFTLLLGSCGSLFLYRLCQNRGYLLSMLLSLGAVEALLNRRHRLLLAVAFLYPLSYTACHVVVMLAILHNVAQLLSGDPVDRRAIPICAAGVMLGLLVHPNGTRALWLWWVQNVRVLTLKWTSDVNLFFGGELYPPDLRTLLLSTTALALTCVVCSLATLLIPRPRAPSTVTMFLVAVSFGFMTLLSKRFIEYAAPFAVGYAAFLLRDLATDEAIRPLMGRRGRFRAVVGLALLIQTGLLAHSYRDVRRDLLAEGKPNMKEPALWLKANTKPGEIVYTADWDYFPELFYYNHANRYLICLDPAFFYEYDSTLWKLWYDVSNAYIQDVYNPIKLHFDSRWLVVTKSFSRLIAKVSTDPRFRKRFEQNYVSIYELTDDLDWITDWTVTGPYPIAGPDWDAKVVDAVGRHPPALSAIKAPVSWPKGRGTFIDLESLLGAAENSSAYASCRVESPIGQTGELRFGFDDAITVWLHGRQILAVRGPTEVSVDFRRIGIALRKGTNTLVVKCTNYTKNWGFYARFVGLASPVKTSTIDR